MIKANEIIDSLTCENNKYFHISDLKVYANKILSLGKSIVNRDIDSNKLSAFVLYYDNNSTLFISMVWTHRAYRRKGLAKNLIEQLIDSTKKDIVLEVNKNNPAYFLYRDLKFKIESETNDSFIMRRSMSLSIMQPYLFPYIGYFQLLEASDKIIFYDDVNYINRGWINRNNILVNEKKHLFTVPLEQASQNKLICETKIHKNKQWSRKILSLLEHSYKKAPNFKRINELVRGIFLNEYENIGDMAINSILSVYNYLDRKINYDRSSVCSPESRNIGRIERLIHINHDNKYKKYINNEGGKILYNKKDFESKGIELNFLKTTLTEYPQFGNVFVPWLSIIDVLMFNNKKNILEQFYSGKII